MQLATDNYTTRIDVRFMKKKDYWELYLIISESMDFLSLNRDGDLTGYTSEFMGRLSSIKNKALKKFRTLKK